MFKDKLKLTIQKQTNIIKLKYLRDTGLDMILNDPDVLPTDFSESDKSSFIELINSRIVELGGAI